MALVVVLNRSSTWTGIWVHPAEDARKPTTRFVGAPTSRVTWLPVSTTGSAGRLSVERIGSCVQPATVATPTATPAKTRARRRKVIDRIVLPPCPPSEGTAAVPRGPRRAPIVPDGPPMDDRPRNLRAMLAEAKELSELMVDLAYAALYFGDPDMAEEVGELEERMDALVHDMRAVCVMAVRDPREADAMASVLQVISSIERIGNAAVTMARIVTHRLGIPRELIADLSNAEEVSHRVR